MSNTPSSPHAERRPRRARNALLASLLTLPLMTNALPQDAGKAIEISADLTQFDNERQTHTLEGNVEIRQGSMVINADKITILLKEGEISRLDGVGEPLRYRVTDNDGETLTATARKIIYKPIDASLSLLGDAKLLRPDRTLSGERIDYDLKSARINARGKDKQRVKIVIQPERKPK